MNHDCVLCAIAEGSARAEVVGANDRAMAIMDINPATDGHTLVISRAHAVDIWDLDAEDGRAIWSLAQEVAAAIRTGLDPHGLTLFQANRKAGWQDVFHFHLHLVPRWRGDDLIKPWQSSARGRDRIAENASRIRSAR